MKLTDKELRSLIKEEIQLVESRDKTKVYEDALKAVLQVLVSIDDDMLNYDLEGTERKIRKATSIINMTGVFM
jgi:hypothetical protein